MQAIRIKEGLGIIFPEERKYNTLMLFRESNMTYLVLEVICSTMDFKTPLACFSLRESASVGRKRGAKTH